MPALFLCMDSAGLQVTRLQAHFKWLVAKIVVPEQ